MHAFNKTLLKMIKNANNLLNLVWPLIISSSLSWQIVTVLEAGVDVWKLFGLFFGKTAFVSSLPPFLRPNQTAILSYNHSLRQKSS